MAEAWATKYRPTEWLEVCGQKSIVKILSRQLETNNIKNAYLFCGASGCGKTTLARIFANKINNNVGSPIEIDGASNNGVDNVKNIIKSAQERSIDSKYKIYIIDECHSLTNQAWQAFLKCIEEPPTFTIFMFCTTDPQKIPATILNRVQRFNINRIGNEEIINRLKFICKNENLENYEESVNYIAKISNGGMRDAIATLEKCAGYSNDLSIQNVLESLGNFSYDMFFSLIKYLLGHDEGNVIKIIDYIHFKGYDLKLFLDSFISFVLDINKYIILKDINLTKLPSSYVNEINNITNFENSSKHYTWYLNRLLQVKESLKNESNIKDMITILFLQIARGE